MMISHAIEQGCSGPGNQCGLILFNLILFSLILFNLILFNQGRVGIPVAASGKQGYGQGHDRSGPEKRDW
jgi:preprotein translocase subunit SecY